MQFELHRPRSHPDLIEAVWEQRSAEPRSWRILPSGRVELIFRLGPAFELQKACVLRPGADPIRQFCFLSGLHTRPLDLSFDELHVFGVRLHPVAVRALFGLPCSAVRDGAVEGHLVLRDLDRIEDRLRAAPDFPARARFVEHELVTRLRASPHLREAQRMRVLATALPTESRTKGTDVLRRLGYSRSHAHRRFHEWFGQPTSNVIRLTRFVRTVRALHVRHHSLTEIGHGLGYFDQAHFIRDFREFSGMTPGEYRARQGAVPGQLDLEWDAHTIRAAAADARLPRAPRQPPAGAPESPRGPT
jgi:AraC-like DNA-binding protein